MHGEFAGVAMEPRLVADGVILEVTRHVPAGNTVQMGAEAGRNAHTPTEPPQCPSQMGQGGGEEAKMDPRL